MNKLVQYLEEIGNKHGWALFVHASAVVLICWIPSQLIWLTFHYVFPGPENENYFKTPLQAVALALLLAPLLETQMMRMIFYAFGKFIKSNIGLCTVSAVIWGILHLSSESWGTHAIWTFFVMGICFRCVERHSKQRAVLIVTAIHAGFNALSYGLYLVVNNGSA
jgi:membrane protease YdiL (CAAX protease family)